MPNKKKYQFIVLATDGQFYWEIFFISTSKEGDFYLGSPLLGFDGKHSRHKSGKMHFKSLETYQNLGVKQDFNNFKGIEQILSCATPMNFFKKETKISFKEYTGKRFDEIILLDTRNYKKAIQISVHLLEKDKFDELAKLPDLFKDRLFIFTQTEPSIIISVFDQG